MKTSVELDDKKVEIAKRLCRINTLRDLLDKALDALIAQDRRRSVADLLGSGFFEGDLGEMRGRRGRPD